MNYQIKFIIGLLVILMLGLSAKLYSQEPVKKDTANVFELSIEELLNADVTTASKSAEKQADAPGIISVLTKDELERFGGTTLKDILERVPGLISSGSNYSDRTTIAVRGDQIKINSGHVLLLINGRPVREIEEGGMSSEMYETFPVNIIEKIEVIKGPGSVLYGSDAFSGVINIITEKAEKNSLSVTGLAGNGGAYGTSGEATIKAGDLGIVVAGRYLQKANWGTHFQYMDYLSGPTPNLVSYDVSIPDKGPGAYLGVNYKGLSLMSTYNEWTNEHFSVLPDQSRWKKIFTNLGYGLKVCEKWNMDFNVTYVNANIDISSIIKSASKNLIAEWTNSINLTTKSKLIIGGLYNTMNGKAYDISTPQEVVISDGNRSDYGLYAQIDYRLLKSLKLIAGMQANKVENIKMNVVPRAGIIWSPVSRFNVKALYSEAFRAPSLSENNINMTYIKGNPDLKPEKVATIDIGISYQGEQAQVGVNFFQSKQTGIIKYNTTGMPPFVYSNLDKVEFKGVEFEGKYYVNKSLYLNASLLYQENKNDSLKNLTPIANIGTKAGISYVWDKGITLSLFDIYQGDLDKRFIGALNPHQGAYNLLHLHSNFNLNKLFAMTFKPVFSLFLNVDNVLDKQHFRYDLGGVSRDGIPGIPGRAIYFGIKVSF
jgi:outer membrane receptor for ferrienterochelin and colicins